MADVARLGIVVDASGAQREIKLTREELVKLANTGTLATRSVAAVKPSLDVMTESSTKSTVGLGRLNNAFVTIARQATNTHPIVGQLADVIGTFAIGTAFMVPVLAGIAALGFAWQRLTADARKAKVEFRDAMEVLGKLKREQDLGLLGEAGAAVGKGRARLGVLGAEIGEVLGRDISSARKTPLLAQLTREYTQVALLVQAGEKEVARIKAEASEESERKAEELAAKKRARLEREIAMQREAAEAERAIARGIAEMMVRDFDARSATANMVRGSIPGFQMSPFLFSGDISAVDAIKKREAQKKLDRQLMLGAGAGIVGGIFERQGGFGGAASGAIGALTAGAGPMGVAAGAAQGLMSAIFGMGEQAKRAAEVMRQLEAAHRAYVDGALFELGRISSGEMGARNAQRDAAAQRGAVLGTGPMSEAEADEYLRKLRMTIHGIQNGDEMRRRLDEINRLEKELVDHRRKEADEMERLATAYRNAPRGFFVESYLSRFPRGVGTDTVTGPTGTLPAGANTGPRGFTGNITINVTNPDPVATANQVIQGLRILGLTTGGSGMSNSDVLNLN